MLPFLKPKRETGIIIRERDPDGQRTPEQNDQEDPGLMAAAADLIRAIHAKDEQGVAMAFKAAFEILELMPHDEAPHEESQE